MNKGKQRLGVTLVVITSQIPFWVMYTQTGNIVISMAVTAVMALGVSAFLYWLGKLDQRKQQ